MYDPYVTETLASSLLVSLGQVLTSSLFSIASYVMTALALYTIAKRRGLHKPWLAWIPVANVWLLGSISDQYRYVAQGQNKSKRKWLLGLEIALASLLVIILGVCISAVVQAVLGATSFYDEDALLRSALGSLITAGALLIPMAAVGIARAVIGYMALYDVYKSLDPANCVMYLVLSILISVTQPFFLLCNRNKDLGMPPRRPESTPEMPPVFDQDFTDFV